MDVPNSVFMMVMMLNSDMQLPSRLAIESALGWNMWQYLHEPLANAALL